MLDPGISPGPASATPWPAWFTAPNRVTKILVVLLVFTLILAIMTAMSGSSRTLFQGGEDGWLPRYLWHLNKHKVPTYAMWTDLCVNLVLLLMSDYVFVLAVSNCNYLIFNFLNLNAGWIHRIDNARVPRPYKAPMPLFVAGACMAYLNAFLMGPERTPGAAARCWRAGSAAAIADPCLLLPALRDGQGQVPRPHVRRPGTRRRDGAGPKRWESYPTWQSPGVCGR